MKRYWASLLLLPQPPRSQHPGTPGANRLAHHVPHGQRVPATNASQNVHGAIPAALRGTAYKVGPGRFGGGSEDYAHWLDGDGYVFALDFSDSGASYCARFVETAGYVDEQEKITWRTTFGTQRPGGPLANAFDLKLKNPANTNVLPVSGRDRVLALWEAGPPHALDMRP